MKDLTGLLKAAKPAISIRGTSDRYLDLNSGELLTRAARDAVRLILDEDDAEDARSGIPRASGDPEGIRVPSARINMPVMTEKMAVDPRRAMR